MQYFWKELSCEVDVLHADTHENVIQVDNIIFDGFSLACPNYPGKFAISLWHVNKEVINEVRNLVNWLVQKQPTEVFCKFCSVIENKLILKLQNLFS